jgi:hypothetical protein
MNTHQSRQLQGFVPTVTGLLSGIIAMLWLLTMGQFQGYGISAILMLYVVIAGTITLVGVLAERIADRL